MNLTQIPGIKKILALLIIILIAAPAAYIYDNIYNTKSSQLIIPQEAMTSAISTVNSISKTEILNLRNGWDSNIVPGHDFNRYGIRGWKPSWSGTPSWLYGITSVPSYLRVPYENIGASSSNINDPPTKLTLYRALILRNDIQAVVLEKAWNISPTIPVRVSLLAMAVQNDGSGPVLVQPGVSYETQAQGLIVTTGPLSYNTTLPYLARGESWILAPATGELRFYSPTGGARVKVQSIYTLGPSTSGQVYILDGAPVVVYEEEQVRAARAMGGDTTFPLKWADGLYSSIVPGNPLIFRVPSGGDGALLLTLAPGVSRAPTKLEAYIYQGGDWRPVWSTWIIPAKGRIAMPINPGPEGLVMLTASQTVILDKVSWAPGSQLKPLAKPQLEPVSYTLSTGEDYTLLRYNTRGAGEWILVKAQAPASLGAVRVMAGAHLTVYGKLWIVGQAPQTQGSWTVVWSDVTEIPPGASGVRVWLVAYQWGQEPDSPTLVAYVKPLLYPVTIAAGYPESSYDTATHTEATVGIVEVIREVDNPTPDMDITITLGFDILAVRTVYTGSSWDYTPNINGIKVSFGSAYGAPPSCPYTYISDYSIYRVSTLKPDSPPAWAGAVDTAVFITTLGSYIATVLSFTVGGPAGAYTAISLSAQATQLADSILTAYYGSVETGEVTGSLDACLQYTAEYRKIEYGWGDDFNTTYMRFGGTLVIDLAIADVEHAVVIFNNYNPTGFSDDDAAYVLYQFYP